MGPNNIQWWSGSDDEYEYDDSDDDDADDDGYDDDFDNDVNDV